MNGYHKRGFILKIRVYIVLNVVLKLVDSRYTWLTVHHRKIENCDKAILHFTENIKEKIALNNNLFNITVIIIASFHVDN